MEPEDHEVLYGDVEVDKKLLEDNTGYFGLIEVGIVHSGSKEEIMAVVKGEDDSVFLRRGDIIRVALEDSPEDVEEVKSHREFLDFFNKLIESMY